MSDLLPQLNRYLARQASSQDSEMLKMEAYAKRHEFPIIGPLVGRVLFQYAMLTKARRIFELGSGYGYSAFWFSLARKANVEIHLTDFESENLDKAKEHFRVAKLKSKFRYHHGDALASFKKSSGKFDIIFNDIHKIHYPEVAKLAIAKLNVGGLLISDNMMMNGKTLAGVRNKAVAGVKEYTRIIYNSPKLWTTIIPLRDGIAVSMKL